MKVSIKRFDKSLPLPVYKTAGAACVDLCSRIDITIPSHQIAYIPLNVALKIPQGYWSMMVPRSSTHKMGIMQANHMGVLDSDYCGDNDEYIFTAYNFTDKEVTIEKGTRIAQLMVQKYESIEFEESDHLDCNDRGGFGTTGNR
ncbi:MAG: dUTP diphosphatase [Candidatus Shapirobacteria bacterium]|nr:dUTP diphosphatase [Candidatus Shapirobacteria bacterium]